MGKLFQELKCCIDRLSTQPPPDANAGDTGIKENPYPCFWSSKFVASLI